MILRVAKEHSVFLYQLLEASEGITNYSTVTADKALGYRDIELFPSPDRREELDALLRGIMKEIPLQIL